MLMMYILVALAEVWVTVVQRTVCIQTLESAHRAKSTELFVWSVYHIVINYFTYFVNIKVLWGNLLVFGIMIFAVEEILFHGSLKSKLLTAFNLLSSSILSEMMAYLALSGIGVDTQQQQVNEQLRLVGSLVSKIFWFAEIRLLLLLNRHKKDIPLLLTDWLEAILVPMGSIALSLILYYLYEDKPGWIGFLALFILFAFNLAMFYLYRSMQGLMVEKMQQRFLAQQKKSYVRQFAEMEQLWENLRQFRHDAKKRYLLEQVYLERGEYEKLRSFYQEALEVLDKKEGNHFTGNPYLDRLISCKWSLAEEKGIQLETELQVPYDFYMDEQDLYFLLGNLLDNAIESANTRINLKMKSFGKNIYFYLSNDYNGERQSDSGRYFRSTKEMPTEHGLGISIVESIVKKYHGEMTVEHGAGRFEVSILLYEADSLLHLKEERKL